MADTEFSGDLMGLESAVFNPSYSSKTSIVVEYVTPVATDMALVDYLVHPKEHMTQIFDVTLGDIPYHTLVQGVKKSEKELKEEKDKEKREEREGKVSENKAFHYSPNPKWYPWDKWNKMQVALRHKAPASCSIPHTPEYEIIHTAPTHASTTEVAIFEIPEPMVEATPLVTIRKITSKVISERDDSRDNMDYDEAYAPLTGKVLSPFFGLKGMDLINAKLDFIGGSDDDEEEDAEEYDSLYGVDCIDESDAEIKHAQTMQAYTQKLLAAAQRVDDFKREHKLSGKIISWSYKMSRAMTVSGMMEGVDALNEYKATPNAFVFNEFEKSNCPEHYTLDEMNELATHSVYTHYESTSRENAIEMDEVGLNHYRPSHWINGNVVETRAQEHVSTTYGPSILNLVKPQALRSRVGSKFPIATVMAIEDEVVFFGAPNMMTHKLSNTGVGLHQNVKRVTKMSADVDAIISVLTSEPKFIKEIGELTGMPDQKVGKILKTAAKAGLVKVVTVKNKATEFRPRATYYI